MHRLLVLGGYGFFGARICAALAQVENLRVLIGGRSIAKATAMCRSVGLPGERAVQIDAGASQLAGEFRRLRVHTVIHAAGPFQGQDYSVARAAIEAGTHYVDLADGRDFVAGIVALDGSAKDQGVTVISGASSLPGLSSAVLDRYRPAFERLDSIRIGIGSGGRTPGLATVRGVFGYCGKPIRRFERGRWVETHGWLDLQRYAFPAPVGRRWLSSRDVPDLELFPARYAPVQTVSFHAGFAASPGHLLVWCLAGLVKAGVINSLAPLAAPISRISRWMEPLVSDRSAMFVEMRGLSREGQPQVKRWHLLAARNHGPFIPCGASIALARKLASGSPLPAGAFPCMGFLSVEEYLSPLQALDIREISDPA